MSDEPFHIATDEEISRLRMNEDYSTLVGPDGWWTFLGEPEDCTWSRDGRDVVDMLNKQAAEIARLTAERDASIAHRSATNEEIKKLHAVIKSKGFSVEDSVALHETRSEAARLTAELHRLAHGADIEGDGMCPHALEAANLRAELAAARAVPADVEEAIDAYEARVTSLVTSMTGRAADDAADVARNNLRAAIARAISEARTGASATVGGLLATARAKFDAVEFMSRSGDGEWTQVNGALGKQYVRVWTSGRKWIDIDGDDALLTGDDYAQPARLVLAAEADRDPNQRGPLPKGG